MKKLLFVFTLSLLMIGMAWGQTVILENDCSTEPEGWELSDAGGQPVYKGSYWLLDTNEDYIISEAIDVADYILLTLSFDVATYGTGTANAALVEYSMDNGTSWEATTFITETPNSSSYIPSGDWLLGELNTTQLKFRWTRPAESGRGVRIKNILLTGIDPSGSPVLNTSVTELIDLDYFEGEGPSAAQSFMLSGVNLTSDVTVTATTSFEIKTDSMLNFGDTITLSPVDGIVAETAIYVRLIAGLSITSYEGTIYITSPGAEDKSIALYGSVNEPPLPADNIFFSEYIEGGSNNKALEIYNPSDEDVDLSNYKMVLYSNGASDPGNTLTMEGMLTPGAVYVTANSSSNQTILDVANSTSTVTYFNGDDAIALVYIPGDEIIDVIGVIGTQTKWDVAGITNATENHTLVRKPTVSQGNTDWSAAAGTNTEDSEWLVFPQDTFNYLGSHTFGEQITETPVISPAEGLNYTPIMVTISTTTPNAEIRYTTDGNIPSETEGTIYTNPFEINTTTTVKAIAYADGYSPSLIASATYYFPVAVADIAALRNGATDGTVYQLEGEAILTFQQSNRNQKYIQDGTAAILIDDAPGNITTSYNDYDGITGIYGTLNFYYGMLQFLPIADPGPATSSGNTVTPELRTLASLTSDDQAKLVKLENVSFVETGTFGNYAANYDIVQDGVTYTLRTFPDTDMSGESIPENTLDIIALVGQYNATMQVSPRSMADMQAVANYPEGDPIPVGENTITFTQGSANEGPVVEELPGWNNSNLDPESVTTLSFSLIGEGPWTISIDTAAPYGAVYYEGGWHAFENSGGVVTIEIPSLTGKGPDVIVVLGDEDPTLPVTLSSFTAVLTADLYVNLAWVAESETNLAGYNILRSEVKELATAIMINPALIEEGTVSGTQISYNYTDTEVYYQTTYYYWLESRSLTGESEYFGPLMVLVNAEGDQPEIPAIPTQTKLLSAFPNPFNPSTNLRYSMKEAGEVRIDIFNVKGQLMKSYRLSHDQAGYYQISWDGRDSNGSYAGTGVYFYRMTSGRYSDTKKMVLAK